MNILRQTIFLIILLMPICILGASKTQKGEYARAFDIASPSVVNISVIAKSRRSGNNIFFFDNFFDFVFTPQETRLIGNGSGVIVDSSGLVITNYHVVNGAIDISIFLYDGTEYKADLLLHEPGMDIALLKIRNTDKKKKFAAMKFADLGLVDIGDKVLAIGNPFGIGQTASSGILSAKFRPVSNLGADILYLQTDAGIHPGNSGGALVNLNGELLGINTFAMMNRSLVPDLGFAIPVDLLKNLLISVKNGVDQVMRPWSGINGVSINVDTKFISPVKYGVIVSDIYKDGPAYKAGIRSGDIIVSVAGNKLGSMHALKYYVASGIVGNTLNLKIYRPSDTKYHSMNMHLVVPPNSPDPNITVLNISNALSGIKIANLSPYIGELLNINKWSGGVVVLDNTNNINSSLIRKGYIIRDINNMRIEKVTDVLAALEKVQANNDKLVIGLEGDGKIMTVHASV